LRDLVVEADPFSSSVRTTHIILVEGSAVLKDGRADHIYVHINVEKYTIDLAVSFQR
jgi:hypothetical protein